MNFIEFNLECVFLALSKTVMLHHLVSQRFILLFHRGDSVFVTWLLFVEFDCYLLNFIALRIKQFFQLFVLKFEALQTAKVVLFDWLNLLKVVGL